MLYLSFERHKIFSEDSKKVQALSEFTPVGVYFLLSAVIESIGEGADTLLITVSTVCVCSILGKMPFAYKCP